VLDEEVLRFGRRLLRGVDLVADRLLPLVDDLEERTPGELPEDPGKEGEDDDGGQSSVASMLRRPPPPPSARASATSVSMGPT